MPITTVLFDLDGTLLPMNQDAFIAEYMKRLIAKMVPHGYNPKELIELIRGGITAMYGNDGSKSNEEAFWNAATSCFGDKILQDRSVLEEFYAVDFDNLKITCGCHPAASQIVRDLKAKGYRVILATNPLFPACATHWRIQWAGLTPDDFELVTTYENSSFCKPNPKYYQAILDQFGLTVDECVMVGNDVTEDMVARTMGMKVFLMTDWIINKAQKDISVYPHGSFDELAEFLKTI